MNIKINKTGIPAQARNEDFLFSKNSSSSLNITNNGSSNVLSFSNLSDVELTDLSKGEFAYYNGEKWVNNSLFSYDSVNNIFKFNASIVSTGDVISYYSDDTISTIWDSLPLATTTTKGGVIVGDGLSITNGVLNVTGSNLSMTFSNNILSLSNGNSVNLSSLAVNLSGYSLTTHTHTFASLTSKPTTLSGYGITDAQSYISTGATNQYYRGDKTWADLTADVVGLGNVGNYSDYARKTINETITGSWTFGASVTMGTKSIKFNKHQLFSSDTADDVLTLRRYGANHTLLNLMSPPQASWGRAHETTIALVRGDDNQYFMDIYNMDYGDVDAGNYLDYGNPVMGIRLQKRGTGIYTPFYFEYSDGRINHTIMKLLPNGTDTTNRSYVHITNDLVVGGEVTSYSDIRLKENIRSLDDDDDIIDKMMMLNPVSYNKIGKTETNIEFIAQEVEKIFPEFVSSDGAYKSVNYAQMVAVCIAVVKKIILKINN